MGDTDSSDYHNFTQPSPSTHRLPTLNGTTALFDAIERHKPISTSLENLDIVLSTSGATISNSGGIARGVITEIYGPPGCGKTHVGLQLAANVLIQEPSAEVVWIDTSSSVPLTRLEHFIATLLADVDPSCTSKHDVQAIEENFGRFDYLQISDLTRLLALLMQPPEKLLSPETRLLIIDNLSNAVMTGLPQNELSTANTFTTSNHLSREEIMSRSVASRRAAMLGAISGGLAQLAASSNIAVVVLNKATSGRRSGDRTAVLRSMLSTPQWNENIATRIVLYRDFWPLDVADSNLIDSSRIQDYRDEPLRIAEVERLGGRDIQSRGVKFVILQHKLQAVGPKLDISTTHVMTLPESSRPLESTNEEAMGNLDLFDAEDVLDESLEMPGDALAASSPAPIDLQGAKRKRDEVADSEDEEDLLARTQDSPEATITNARGGQFTGRRLAVSVADDGEMLLK